MKKMSAKTLAAMSAAVLAVSSMAPLGAFAAEKVDHTAGQTYTYDSSDSTTDKKWDEAYGDQTGDPTPSAKVNVSYENDPTYTVTIPKDVKFEENLDDTYNDVIVENVYLNKGQSVKVTVASANGYKMLLGGTDTETYVPYELESDKATIGDVITVPTGSLNRKGEGTAKLTYKVTDKDVPYAGDYSDILTFTIAVVNDDGAAPAALTLTIQVSGGEPLTLEYEEDYTWQDMLNKYSDILSLTTWSNEVASTQIIKYNGKELKHEDSANLFTCIIPSDKVVDYDLSKYTFQ